MHTVSIIAEVVAGLAAYLALILFIARGMAFGMGTLPPPRRKLSRKAQREAVDCGFGRRPI